MFLCLVLAVSSLPNIDDENDVASLTISGIDGDNNSYDISEVRENVNFTNQIFGKKL